ncbi:hypothetical protein [Hymenobacter terricola]|uniref:hypothetical protein n=1 Tax=Hymenobacter terricola TaxID=2819236 RepID=UPI001B30C035|nr:hypothetical protein [Hymenobacter terricola]
MHVNTDPPTPTPAPKKACIRDMADLVKNHLPCAVVKLTSLDELERRCTEIAAELPRFKEEAPIVLAVERHRRARHLGVQLAAVYQEMSLPSPGYARG